MVPRCRIWPIRRKKNKITSRNRFYAWLMNRSDSWKVLCHSKNISKPHTESDDPTVTADRQIHISGVEIVQASTHGHGMSICRSQYATCNIPLKRPRRCAFNKPPCIKFSQKNWPPLEVKRASCLVIAYSIDSALLLWRPIQQQQRGGGGMCWFLGFFLWQSAITKKKAKKTPPPRLAARMVAATASARAEITAWGLQTTLRQCEHTVRIAVRRSFE